MDCEQHPSKNYTNSVRFIFRFGTLAWSVQSFVIVGLGLELLPTSRVASWVLLGIFKRQKPSFIFVLACPLISFDEVITFQVMAVRLLNFRQRVLHLKSQIKS